MLPEEPKGWRELQEMAQSERDPKKLAKIIDRMNELLAEQEKKARGERPSGDEPKRGLARE